MAAPSGVPPPPERAVAGHGQQNRQPRPEPAQHRHAEVPRGDRDVDLPGTGDLLAADPRHRYDQSPVAVVVGEIGEPGCVERRCAGGDEAGAQVGSGARQHAASTRELVSDGGEVGADAGSRLDLAAGELRDDRHVGGKRTEQLRRDPGGAAVRP